MEKMTKSLSFGFALFIAVSSFAQTVTIDYSYASLSNSCNVFANSTVYQTFSHRTSFGFPYYSTAENAIALQSMPLNAATQACTQYAVRYPFKQGFTYQIKLYGKSTLGSTANSALPSASISWSNDSSEVNNSTNCTGPITKSSAFDINYGHIAFTTTWSWSPALISGVAPQNLNFLLVAAFPKADNYASDNKISLTLIRKIEIVEIPPAGSFSILPTAPSMTCGSSLPLNFTVNNNANIANITNYTWNLGPVPNGWLLPNGSPAPSTYSTGTANTLQLTPECGRALSPVSATITANGNNYNSSNSSVVSIVQPGYKISGGSILCNSNANYSVDSLVCNSSVLWTPPPSNFGNLSTLTASPTTLTYGGTSGNFALTANVSSCGVTTPVTLPVHVGGYTNSDFVLSGNNGSPYYCTNQTISFGVSGASGVAGANGSNYLWTIPTGWTQSYNGGSYIAITSPSSTYPPTGSLSVDFTEPCGTTISKSFFLAYSSSACTGTDPRYTYSPNPAPTYLNVAVASAYLGTTYIKKIELVSVNTGLSVYFQDYTYSSVTSTTISMTGFSTGTYTLRIFDGTTWSAYNILH